MIAKLKDKQTYVKFIKDFKFAMYCTRHPMDGFWDLTHEKCGSYVVATLILLLTIAARLIWLGWTSFVFVAVNWERINVLTYVASILLPLALFVVGNWALTTLFNGKGKLGQVYIAACYALTPYPLITIPLAIITNGLTDDFASVVGTILTFSLVWCGWLLVTGMMQIHEYTMGGTIICVIATVFAMAVMVFILLLFFSMISQGISYFVSLYKEIMLRVG